MRNVKTALKKPDDYDARAEIMWSGTLSHNDITGDRTLGDWACHQLEHELGGMFDIAHGAGLAAVWGSWARYVMPVNPARFAQLAVNVFGIPYTAGAEEKIALEGIEAMEAFFKSIGMPTKSAIWIFTLPMNRLKSWHINAALTTRAPSAALKH